jgi:hypothetical protein
LVPPEQLYEVCEEDGVDVDVDDEPESDGSADAAHDAAANPVPDPRSGRPPVGGEAMTLQDGLDIQVPQPALLSLADDVVVVTRDLVERAQPGPHLFLAAARRLGVDPAHCFVVGDSICDLLAAQRAGALASDCSRVATVARSSTGRARTASTPTRPRC